MQRMLKLRFAWICFLVLGPGICLKADAPLNLAKLSLEELMNVEVSPAHADKPPRPYQLGSIVHPAARPADKGISVSEVPAAPDWGEPNTHFPVTDFHLPDDWLSFPRQKTIPRQMVPEPGQPSGHGPNLLLLGPTK